MTRLTLLHIVLLMWLAASAAYPQDLPDGPPRIFLDKSPRIVAYQLSRLTNEQLVLVERKTDDAKYKPIYEALLARPALAPQYRQEALDALVTLNASDRVTELLAGIARIEAASKDDAATIGELVSMLSLQPAEALKAKRERLIQASADAATGPAARRAAYVGLIIADTAVEDLWRLTGDDAQRVRDLLGAMALVGDRRKLAGHYERVRSLVAAGGDDVTHHAAIEAFGFIPGHETQAFTMLADLFDADVQRAAVVASIRRVAPAGWPKDRAAQLAQKIIAFIASLPVEKRTEPEVANAVLLGNQLAGVLEGGTGEAVRRRLNELGVRVVLIGTIREQILFDRRHFAVAAGKPVQIIFENTDVMPHNLVIVMPGSVQEVGIAAALVPMSNDPKVRQFVPDSDKVLHATHLVQPGGLEKLSFTAPTTPGDYPYVCTFPGHWLRMYGVMVVVEDVDVWEKSGKEPNDPLTGQPFVDPPAPDHSHKH